LGQRVAQLVVVIDNQDLPGIRHRCSLASGPLAEARTDLREVEHSGTKVQAGDVVAESLQTANVWNRRPAGGVAGGRFAGQPGPQRTRMPRIRDGNPRPGRDWPTMNPAVIAK